jgi:hypothetical protein
MLGRTMALAAALLLATPAAASARRAVLLGVSCSAPDACVAAGTDESDLASGGRALLVSWDGGRWTDAHNPSPADAANSNLYDVSCPTAGFCMAVGAYDSSDEPQGSPLAELWNGSAWSIVPVPRPAGADLNDLDRISCAGPAACVATGFALIGGHNNAIAAIWNGTSWQLTALPRPAGTTGSSLDGVSCASASACTAVGDYQVHESSKSKTLAMRWDGSRWTIQRTPNPSSGPNGRAVNGVSCPSPTACVAVGSANNASNTGSVPLAMRWDGMAWSLTPARNPAHVTVLFGVSCTSAASCIAVGDGFSARGRGTTVSERWNGKAWSVLRTPVPARATFVDLQDVWCASPAACMVAGNYSTDARGDIQMPLAMMWNGSAWKRTPGP